VDPCNRTLEERQAYRGQFPCQPSHLVDLRKRSMEREADELRAGNALGLLGEKVPTPTPRDWAGLMVSPWWRGTTAPSPTGPRS
jgi:hypothetical protein